MGFTAITDDTVMHDIAVLNEIIDAINERYYFLTGVDLLEQVADGTNVQTVDFWRGLQEAVEYVAGMFYLDPEQVISGNLPGLSPMTSDRLYELAGLPEYGWRRATTWPLETTENPDGWEDLEHPTYANGFFEEDDIIGPWLLVDLQASLRVMSDCYSPTSWVKGVSQLRVVSYEGYLTLSCADSREEFSDEWDATSPSTYPEDNPIGEAIVTRYSVFASSDPWPWRWGAERSSFKGIAVVHFKFAGTSFKGQLYASFSKLETTAGHFESDLEDLWTFGEEPDTLYLVKTDNGIDEEEWDTDYTFGGTLIGGGLPHDLDTAVVCPITTVSEHFKIAPVAVFSDIQFKYR